LFQAAGLDMSAFQPIQPQWTPLANWDARAAWTGSDPQTGAKLRIEAAVWRGRPVFFRILGPWNHPERMVAQADTGNQVPFLIVIYAAMFSAYGIAWHNFRAGKSDRRGALKLALIYFGCEACGHFLETHHTATLQELEKFWMSV